MTTYQLIIAISLLSNPEGTPQSDSVNAVHGYLAPALKELAIKLEIMDPREKAELFVDPQNFPFDLKLLQRRFQELMDAPRVGEADRFPEREAVNELLSLNRDYKEYLQHRMAIDPLHADMFQQAIEETDQLHQVWATLKDARGCYYVSARRQSLKNLRDMIGVNAFYRAELPPHLPIWRVPRSR